MGSGFKSRGVHHWENSLRFVETQAGGCFVIHGRRPVGPDSVGDKTPHHLLLRKVMGFFGVGEVPRKK